jgi:hypothetical protein
VRAAVFLRNIVRKAEHIFLVSIVPLQRSFDDDAVLFDAEMQHGGMNWRLIAIQVLDEGSDTAFELKNILLAVAFILQVNLEPRN